MDSSQATKPETVMRVRDVALHLGCTNDTVYHLVHAGEIRAIRVGRLVRIPESALRDFIARGDQ